MTGTWMDKGIRDEVDMAQFANAQAGPLFDKSVVPADPQDANRIFANMAIYGEPQMDWRDIRIIELEASLRGALDAGRGLNAVCVAHEKRAIAYEARIAELEAALRAIRDRVAQHYPWTVQDVLVTRIANTVLPQLPEGDMAITQEEVGA